MKINLPRIELELDKTFAPAVLYFDKYEKEVRATKNFEEITIVIERMDGLSEKYDTVIFHQDEKREEENLFYLEKLVKTLLWVYGGFKIIVVGPKYVSEKLDEIFNHGSRTFDARFMERIYEQPFQVVHADKVPEIKRNYQSVGKNYDGYRIGFDAGGSDMKVSAVVDGEAIHSEEIVWLPKLNEDPLYHKKMIRKAINRAVEKMPRVDALGVSSAGVYIHNEAKVASLFIKVNDEDFKKHVKNIYIDVAKELNVPLEVANDGDVTALAGSISLKKNNLLGIAMGTSEAVGYINKDGNITGWLNELAFAPVDLQENGPVDEWSLDIGVGCKYFSQDAVIRLAEDAGIVFDENLTLAEKLKYVQDLGKDNEIFQNVFKTIGGYLAFGLAFYSKFYDIESVLLLGRVLSGDGGKLMVETAEKTLKEHFKDLSEKIELSLPDEKTIRVGQSIAASSLPKIK